MRALISLALLFFIISTVSSTFFGLGFCLPKLSCKLGLGICLASDSWSMCQRTIDSTGCYGLDCGCCRFGKCRIEPMCANYRGYCYEKNSNYVCSGIPLDDGCGSTSCACCIMDPNVCILNTPCRSNNGRCILQGDACATGESELSDANACLGNCKCCYVPAG